MIANLEGLIDDGLKARFPYSFYFYKGSLSQPTCKSEVLRAVMYTKIDVAVDLFDSFKSKVMDGYKDK
jgi:carbonic anhydrase